MSPPGFFPSLPGPLLWLQAALVIICVAADGYYLLGILSARDFFSNRRPTDPDFHPPISILKPLRGLDPDAHRNLSSFFDLDYPEYEVLFGLESPDDPVLPVVRAIMDAHPETPARVVFYEAPADGNPKVASLASAAEWSRHSLLLLSDADIRVGRLHLRAMAQPMQDPGIGVVTCLYRSEGKGFAGRLDALGLSTAFQRDALVARRVEGVSFAMGSGILIRRRVLDAIGGFEAVTRYLSDDFLLGNLPTRQGYRVEFAHDVVDHSLGTKTFRDLVRNQLRWNRGIRASRPGGYLGLFFTYGVAIALLEFGVSRASPLGGALLVSSIALSIFSAWLISCRFLADGGTRSVLWAVPLREVLGFLLWLGGLFGASIDWRGRKFRLGRDGILLPRTAPNKARPPGPRSSSAGDPRASGG